MGTGNGAGGVGGAGNNGQPSSTSSNTNTTATASTMTTTANDTETIVSRSVSPISASARIPTDSTPPDTPLNQRDTSTSSSGTQKSSNTNSRGDDSRYCSQTLTIAYSQYRFECQQPANPPELGVTNLDYGLAVVSKRLNPIRPKDASRTESPSSSDSTHLSHTEASHTAQPEPISQQRGRRGHHRMSPIQEQEQEQEQEQGTSTTATPDVPTTTSSTVTSPASSTATAMPDVPVPATSTTTASSSASNRFPPVRQPKLALQIQQLSDSLRPPPVQEVYPQGSRRPSFSVTGLSSALPPLSLAPLPSLTLPPTAPLPPLSPSPIFPPLGSMRVRYEQYTYPETRLTMQQQASRLPPLRQQPFPPYPAFSSTHLDFGVNTSSSPSQASAARWDAAGATGGTSSMRISYGYLDYGGGAASYRPMSIQDMSPEIRRQQLIITRRNLEKARNNHAQAMDWQTKASDFYRPSYDSIVKYYENLIAECEQRVAELEQQPAEEDGGVQVTKL